MCFLSFWIFFMLLLVMYSPNSFLSSEIVSILSSFSKKLKSSFCAVSIALISYVVLTPVPISTAKYSLSLPKLDSPKLSILSFSTFTTAPIGRLTVYPFWFSLKEIILLLVLVTIYINSPLYYTMISIIACG